MAKYWVSGLMVFVVFWILYVTVAVPIQNEFVPVVENASNTTTLTGPIQYQDVTNFWTMIFELLPYIGAFFGVMVVVVGAIIEEFGVRIEL